MAQRLCWLELLRGARSASSDLVAAGATVSAAVDAQGRLRVWGTSVLCGNFPHVLFRYCVPTPISSPQGVRGVSVGSTHVLAITDEGAVLSFGGGEYGKLGHGDRADQREPKVIEALHGVRVAAIAAARVHSMVLTDEGTVLSFGCGVVGQLGHGLDVGQYYCRYEPKVIEALRGVRVVAIAAGHRHSMVLTDKGTVLSFGDGWSGQLGHGAAVAVGTQHDNVLSAPMPAPIPGLLVGPPQMI